MFSTGSGNLGHCYHVRLVDGVSALTPVPTEPTSDVGDSSDDEEADPVKAADKVVRKACEMTKAEWADGQVHWKDPSSSARETFDFFWDEMCKVCDNSFHATAIMQKRMIHALQECKRAEQEDPNRKSLGTSDTGSQVEDSFNI